MIRRTVAIVLGLILILSTMIVVSGCTGQGEPAFANSMTENILKAMNDGDYTRYSANFNKEMKSAATEEVFNQTNAQIKAIIGNYISKEYWKTETQEGYVMVYYMAKFTGEPQDVAVRIVFQDIDGEMYVAGIWFDSPKLRESS